MLRKKAHRRNPKVRGRVPRFGSAWVTGVAPREVNGHSVDPAAGAVTYIRPVDVRRESFHTDSTSGGDESAVAASSVLSDLPCNTTRQLQR